MAHLRPPTRGTKTACLYQLTPGRSPATRTPPTVSTPPTAAWFVTSPCTFMSDSWGIAPLHAFKGVFSVRRTPEHQGRTRESTTARLPIRPGPSSAAELLKWKSVSAALSHHLKWTVKCCRARRDAPDFTTLFLQGDINTGGIVAGVIVALLLLALLGFGIWYAHKKGYLPSEFSSLAWISSFWKVVTTGETIVRHMQRSAKSHWCMK